MYQESGGVEGGDGYGVKNLRLLQSIQLFFPTAKNTFSEGILPGIKLQDLYSTQDLIHKLNASVHVRHLDLLRAPNRLKNMRIENHVSKLVYQPRQKPIWASSSIL